MATIECPEKPIHMNGEHSLIWDFLQHLDNRFGNEMKEVRADLRENRKFTAQLFLILFVTVLAAGGSIIGVLLSGALN